MDLCRTKRAHQILCAHQQGQRFLEYGGAHRREVELEEFRVALGKAKQAVMASVGQVAPDRTVPDRLHATRPAIP